MQSWRFAEVERHKNDADAAQRPVQLLIAQRTGDLDCPIPASLLRLRVLVTYEYVSSPSAGGGVWRK